MNKLKVLMFSVAFTAFCSQAAFAGDDECLNACLSTDNTCKTSCTGVHPDTMMLDLEVYTCVLSCGWWSSAACLTDCYNLFEVPCQEACSDALDICASDCIGATMTVPLNSEPLVIDVSCTPETLNLKSKGKWITCYIGVPEGSSSGVIEPGSISLNYEGSVLEVDKYAIEDQRLMVKFDRQEIHKMIMRYHEIEGTDVPEEIVLTVSAIPNTIKVKK